MVARIYKPAKTAMQSGTANTKRWILEYEPEDARFIDPIMGWTGTEDNRRQVKLRFETQEEAVVFAQRQNISYEVAQANEASLKPKSYAENFK